MHLTLQRLCVWSGPVFLLLYVLAFGGLARYLPPQPPTMALADLVSFYRDNQFGIRAGQLLGLIFSTLLFPWFGIISLQIAKAEGKVPILALMQFGGGVLLIVFFQVCSMIWITATYRVDMDPLTLRSFHDAGWLFFVMVFPAYVMQLLCIGLAGFLDKRPTPIFPRWVAYFNIWVGLGGAGGGLAVFFYSGPFAWNGVIGFWVPVILFAVWLCVMVPFLLRNVGDPQNDTGRLPRDKGATLDNV